MEPYLGEIRIFAGTYAPQNWAFCQGQLLSTNDYNTLFYLIGTTYGGDGQNTFALPDLRSRVAVGLGTMPSGTNYQLGQVQGTENVTLTSAQVPAHGHAFAGTVGVVTDTGTPQANPTGNYFGSRGATAYAASLGDAPDTLPAGAVAGTSTPAGSASPQAHTNVQPVLATNYIICLSGIFPSQP